MKLDKTIFKNRCILLFLFELFYAMAVSYGHFIESEFHNVSGYDKVDFSILFYCFNALVVTLYGFLFPINLYKVSDYVVLIVLLLINIPIGYFLLIKTDSILYFIFVSILNFVWFTLWLSLRKLDIKLEKINFRFSIKNIIFLCLLVVVFYFILKNNMSIIIHDKAHIYEQRTEFKKMDLNIVMRYLMIIIQYSIIPIIITIAIKLNSYILKFILISAAVYMAFIVFSLTALKSSLFILIFVLIGYLIYRFKIYSSIRVLLYACLGLFFFNLSYKSSSLLTNIYLHSLRRFLYVPTKTGAQAYDYFLNHCNDCGFYNGVNVSMGQVLSRYYYGMPNGNSTTGFLANGFLENGIGYSIGMILLFLITLKAIDFSTKEISLKYTLPALIAYGYVLSNTALTAALLSYGLIFSLIIIKFLKNWIQK